MRLIQYDWRFQFQILASLETAFLVFFYQKEMHALFPTLIAVEHIRQNTAFLFQYYNCFQCKPSCGVGRKSRTVSCMSSDRRHRYDNESKCDLLTKPSTTVQCSTRPCPPPRWQYGKWSSVRNENYGAHAHLQLRGLL